MVEQFVESSVLKSRRPQFLMYTCGAPDDSLDPVPPKVERTKSLIATMAMGLRKDIARRYHRLRCLGPRHIEKIQMRGRDRIGAAPVGSSGFRRAQLTRQIGLDRLQVGIDLRFERGQRRIGQPVRVLTTENQSAAVNEETPMTIKPV